MMAFVVLALICISAPLARCDSVPGFVQVPSKYFETGTAAVYVNGTNQTLSACAQSCSTKADCQSFVFNGNTSTCILQPLRPCQVLAIRPAGNLSQAPLGDIYERNASVVMGGNSSYTPLFKDRCGAYTGAVIEKTRQSVPSNGTDNGTIATFGDDCGNRCLNRTTPNECKSFLATIAYTTQTNGSTTLDLTCTLYLDSVYSTPVHGFYTVTNTAQCADNQTTIYGLGRSATSQLNCGVAISDLA